MGASSAGGQISNVNLWDRIIPESMMNTLLWNGNIFSMTSEQVALAAGDITTVRLSFNVSGRYTVYLTICFRLNKVKLKHLFLKS